MRAPVIGGGELVNVLITALVPACLPQLPVVTRSVTGTGSALGTVDRRHQLAPDWPRSVLG